MRLVKTALTLYVATFSIVATAQANPQRPAPHILAIGNLTSPLTPAERSTLLPSEVRATVKLYLDGKIDQWWFREDGNGPVFLLNVATVDEASSILDQLPLGVAKRMTFQFTPIGPLKPLQMLLSEQAAK